MPNKLLAFGREKPTFSAFAHANGLVAQLEERLNGIEEVVSSNLIGSTNSFKHNELRNVFYARIARALCAYFDLNS